MYNNPIFDFIYCNGRREDIHQQGVGLCLSNKARKARYKVEPVNERLMKIRLNCKWFKTIVICVYAPTEEGTEEEKDDFYDSLQQTINGTSKQDIIMLMGDFNAKIGSETEAFVPRNGNESLHVTSKDNGLKLISLAPANNFVIGGIIFPHKEIHKQTWRSPDRRTNNQIDHILISRKHWGTLGEVRSFRGADCNTHHYLVCAKVRAKLKVERSRPVEKIKSFYIEKLKEDNTRNNIQLKLTNRFQILSIQGEEQAVYDQERQEWRRRHNWELRERTNPDISRCVKGRRMQGAGHFARMEEQRMPRRVFLAHVDERRPPGRPRKDWRRCFEDDLQQGV
ncbi:craniofacial development protein 2-like [Palaemon carinicauda]|uniref:craniofacial development protein 2-like n=1 Tax=Palaemon carinicauda TaxID=392227 RepID=UPI0035B5EA32